MRMIRGFQMGVAVRSIRIEHVIVPAIIRNRRIVYVRQVPFILLGPGGDGPVVIRVGRYGLSVRDGRDGSRATPSTGRHRLDGGIRILFRRTRPAAGRRVTSGVDASGRSRIATGGHDSGRSHQEEIT